MSNALVNIGRIGVRSSPGTKAISPNRLAEFSCPILTVVNNLYIQFLIKYRLIAFLTKEKHSHLKISQSFLVPNYFGVLGMDVNGQGAL